MMKKNTIYTILGAAVGTGLAAYGIRKGMRWYQRRQLTHRVDTQLPESAWPAERRYQPIDQPDREVIPSTGYGDSAPGIAPAPPLHEMTAAERVNSDRISDFDDRTTAFTITELDQMAEEEIARGEAASTGSEMYGGAGAPAQRFSAEEYVSSQTPDIVMDEYVGPLIEHAIAFNSVMNLLRSRQRSGEGYEGTESLTEGDRSSMRAVLDQMQEHVPQQDEATLRANPLAYRSYKLTGKLREALDNLSYSGSDLFRIYGEVKTELCGLARELENSGKVTITGLDQIRQLYECG